MSARVGTRPVDTGEPMVDSPFGLAVDFGEGGVDTGESSLKQSQRLVDVIPWTLARKLIVES